LAKWVDGTSGARERVGRETEGGIVTFNEADMIVRDLRASGADREALLDFICELLMADKPDDEAVDAIDAFEFTARGSLHGALFDAKRSGAGESR
jgi:hypothetical protein